MITEISIVVPILNERGNIMNLYEKLYSELKNLNKPCEFIFVDDGSIDGSFGVLSDLAKNDHRVKVVKFLKNFGQTAAIAAGVNYAKGAIIILMDGDLQNDPQDIGPLLKEVERGYDVVSGWRRKRLDPLLSKRVPSYFANRLISLVTGIRLHDFGCTLKAYRREVLKEINLFGEMHRFMPVLAFRLGYSITEIPVSHHKRLYGKSKYGLNRVFRVILDLPILVLLRNYSIRTNYLFRRRWGLILIFISFLPFLLATFYRFQKETNLSTIIFATGILLFAIGLLLEAASRLYYETTLRKPYIIKTIIDFDKEKI